MVSHDAIVCHIDGKDAGLMLDKLLNDAPSSGVVNKRERIDTEQHGSLDDARPHMMDLDLQRVHGVAACLRHETIHAYAKTGWPSDSTYGKPRDYSQAMAKDQQKTISR